MNQVFRGIAVGIYTTNTAEASRHNAYDSKANIIVVDDDKQLQKILKIRGELPELKAIVQYTGKPAVGPENNVYSWSEFLDLAKYVPDIALINRQRAMSPNRCCTLIYTSGTTGNPKVRTIVRWLQKIFYGMLKIIFPSSGCDAQSRQSCMDFQNVLIDIGYCPIIRNTHRTGSFRQLSPFEPRRCADEWHVSTRAHQFYVGLSSNLLQWNKVFGWNAAAVFTRSATQAVFTVRHSGGVFGHFAGV